MADIQSPSSISPSTSNDHRSSELKEKVRILCLHGYRQDGDTLKNKLGSFRKFVNKYAELVFVTAPHQVPAAEKDGQPEPHQRSWWANKEDGTFKGTHKSAAAIGFQKSLDLVEDVWKTQGPFQGLLGFSQGACFVGLLCGLAARDMTIVQPEFAILAAGFVSGSLAHKGAYDNDSVGIPSLHIFGLTDEIITPEMSQELLPYFKDVQVLQHAGGHYFPATTKEKLTYVEFIQDRLQEHLENLYHQQMEDAPEDKIQLHKIDDDDDDNDDSSDD